MCINGYALGWFAELVVVVVVVVVVVGTIAVVISVSVVLVCLGEEALAVVEIDGTSS